MLTNYRNHKRSDKMCPNCFIPSDPKTWIETVDKDNRICKRCKCRLIWDGDDDKKWIERMDNYFVWHRSPFNVIGWFHKSYFLNKHNVNNKY